MRKSMPGSNIGGAGEHNRRAILQGLRINGAMTRAQIARATGLVPQTVSNIMGNLVADGLVLATEPVRAGRGQPATPYSLAATGAYSYGIQIDSHRARVVAVNLLGAVVTGTEITLTSDGLQANLPAILETLTWVARDLMARVAPATPRILGLGLAVPAPTGVHAQADDPWIANFFQTHPMVAALHDATGLPVSLHHDASAAAVAERLNGSAVGIDNFVLLFVGYGLGAGIYTQGQPYRGHHRLAGEIGLISVSASSGATPLEELTSLSSLFAQLGLRPEQPDLDARIESAVHEGDPVLDCWLEIAARHLVWAIDLVRCLLDPEIVVISGQMPCALMDRLMAQIRAAQMLHSRQAQRPGRASAGDPHASAAEEPVSRLGEFRVVQGSAGILSIAASAATDPIAQAFDPSFTAMMKARA